MRRLSVAALLVCAASLSAAAQTRTITETDLFKFAVDCARS